MAYNTGNTQLDNLLNFIKNTWGITFSQADIERWKQDLAGTGSRPRTMSELRRDILHYRVGDEKIRQWAVAAGVPEDELDQMVEDLKTGTQTFNQVSQTYTPPESTTGTDLGAPPEEEDTAEEGEGGEDQDEETSTTILTSKNMKWYFDPNSGKWYVSYKLPNSNRELIFEATPDQMDALYGQGLRPTNYTRIRLADLTAQAHVTLGGNISAVYGTGTFESEVERVTALALDEGRLPEWASNDPAIMDIIFIAQSTGKSDEWIIEQISKLPSFARRFPHIEALKTRGNLTTVEAVTSFLEFEAGIKSLAAEYGQSPEAITPAMVGSLMEQGYSLTFVKDSYSIWKRMEDFAPALEAFNQILVAQGKSPLTEDDMIKFLQGNAPQDIYDTYEAFAFKEAANIAGLDEIFSAQRAIEVALQTPGMVDPASAAEAIQRAAQMLLRMRQNVNTAQFGLTVDELIDLNLGVLPQSGRSQAEIMDSVNRAMLTAQEFIQSQGVRAFTGFTEEGVPRSQSLGRVRQEY